MPSVTYAECHFAECRSAMLLRKWRHDTQDNDTELFVTLNINDTQLNQAPNILSNRLLFIVLPNAIMLTVVAP
jgi:hypothetical protein